MFQLLNYIVIFITIISTVKMLFLDIHNKNHRKIEKENKNTINNNTTPLYNKEYKENPTHICIDNNTYYIDIRNDKYIDELQTLNSNLNTYIYA